MSHVCVPPFASATTWSMVGAFGIQSLWKFHPCQTDGRSVRSSQRWHVPPSRAQRRFSVIVLSPVLTSDLRFALLSNLPATRHSVQSCARLPHPCHVCPQRSQVLGSSQRIRVESIWRNANALWACSWHLPSLLPVPQSMQPFGIGILAPLVRTGGQVAGCSLFLCAAMSLFRASVLSKAHRWEQCLSSPVCLLFLYCTTGLPQFRHGSVGK